VAAREVATVGSSSVTGGVCAVARFARLDFIIVANLGVRSAPPQALRYRPARRANTNPTDDEHELDQTSLK